MSRIIVDDFYTDSASETLLDVLSATGPAEIVTLSRFIHEAGFRYDDRTGFLRMVAGDSPDRDPAESIYNRVVNVSGETASKIDGGKSVLHPSVVLGAYAGLIDSMTRVWGALTPYPAAQMLPVNLQWKILAKHVPGIETPKFVYEMNEVTPDLTDLINPLEKDPFDAFDWKTPNIDPSRPHTFVVDKPDGYPVVSYFVGETGRAFDAKSGSDLDPIVERNILALTPGIRNAFKAAMGECLFFVSENHVIFAAFTRYMKSSAVHPSFRSVVESGLAAAPQCA